MSKSSKAIMKKYLCVSLAMVIIRGCLTEGCNITRRSRTDEGAYPDGSAKQRYPRLLTFHTHDNDVVVGAKYILLI